MRENTCRTKTNFMGKEKVKNTYDVVCACGDTVHVAKISEIDMSGWTLFECYLLFSGQVVYFSQDSSEDDLEYIDMEDELPTEWKAPLIHAIRQQKAA